MREVKVGATIGDFVVDPTAAAEDPIAQGSMIRSRSSCGLRHEETGCARQGGSGRNRDAVRAAFGDVAMRVTVIGGAPRLTDPRSRSAGGRIGCAGGRAAERRS
ncbi:hypothetical protein [Methylobacterium sp. J-092]|uniref:hypothetical protein n=1 Tax=Methylobacterium sp. J-092 TaxID=2836667 RepID=UPI001FB97108|nr:hypothetical protein [Methylobacterium sp. J-092]MCJ2010782.1 hypothetical protein [Methylobacterium sp. J-092]